LIFKFYFDSCIHVFIYKILFISDASDKETSNPADEIVPAPGNGKPQEDLTGGQNSAELIEGTFIDFI